MKGIVPSPEFKLSPTLKGGLEIILKVTFSIKESSSKVLGCVKELFDEYYHPVLVQRSPEPAELSERGGQESVEIDDDVGIFIGDSEENEEDN